MFRKKTENLEGLEELRTFRAMCEHCREKIVVHAEDPWWAKNAIEDAGWYVQKYLACPAHHPTKRGSE